MLVFTLVPVNRNPVASPECTKQYKCTAHDLYSGHTPSSCKSKHDNMSAISLAGAEITEGCRKKPSVLTTSSPHSKSFFT